MERSKTSVKNRSTSSNAEQRIVYYDILRAIAPIFVVFIHAAVTFGGHTLKIHFIQEFGRWAVPIFFMISGALLLNPKKKFNTKTFYLKNIKRIVIALVAWLVIYTVLFALLSYSAETREYAIGASLAGRGESYHLWFLYTLVAIYLLVPIIRYICKNEKLLKYAIIMGCIACYVLPFLDTLLSIVAHLTNNALLLGFTDNGGIVCRFANQLSTFSLAYYFILGYYLSVKDINKKTRRMIYLAGIIGTILDLAWVIIGEKIVGIPITASYYFLPVLCMSIAVFVAARYLFINAEKTPKIISFMAKNSFGVYLCHLALLLFVFNKSSFFANNSSILAILIGTIATYLASIIISWLISLVPGLKKIV